MAQCIISVVFETKDPIEVPTAVEMGTDGKLIPCSDANNFFGIAVPGLDVDVTTLRTDASTGPLVVVHKGLARATMTAGTYIKGSPLTIDANTGKLKLADIASGDVVVAYSTEDVVVADGDVLTVFIR